MTHDTRWYEDHGTLVLQLENEYDTGIRELHARETADGWEYAVVWWFHGTCRLQHLIKNGKAVKSDG